MRSRAKYFVMCAAAGVGLLAYGGDSVVARQSGACPTEGSCYRQNCQFACVTMKCDADGSCPDPGELGDRCYVCTSVE